MTAGSTCPSIGTVPAGLTCIGNLTADPWYATAAGASCDDTAAGSTPIAIAILLAVGTFALGAVIGVCGRTSRRTPSAPIVTKLQEHGRL